MKALLVDDKVENLYLLETILKATGYITTMAMNGAEALEFAQKDTPDLIIADILMPVMDGFSLCREIKKDKVLCKIPFIFYTATYTDPKDEEFALSLGADRFVLKPQDPDDLMVIIEEVLLASKNKNREVTITDAKPETMILKGYNEALVRKLEDKMLQLERSEKEIRENNILLRKEIEERKQAEAATIRILESLRESEERYRLLFESSLDAVLITNPIGEIIDVNPSTCLLFGWTKDEFRKLKIDQVLDMTDQQLPGDKKEHLLTGIFNGELTAIRKDGSVFPVELSSTLSRDRNGNTQASMIIRDITERNRTMKALTISETRYRRLFESAKDGILILDAESGIIIDINPFLIKMLNYPNDKYLRKKIWEMDFFKDIADSKDKFLDFRKSRYVHYPDLTLETAAGKKINVEFISNLYTVNQHNVIQCNIRDITERKRSEEELAFERNLVISLMDNIPDLIYFKDINSRFIRTNKSHAGKLGLESPSQAIGKTDFDFFTKEHAQQAFEDEKKIMETGKPIVDIEEKETWPDGRETWVSTTKVPLRDASKQIIGTFGISRDITKRKLIENALKASENKFRQFIETAVEGICSVDIDENISFVNQRLAEMLGYQQEDIIGKNIESFMFPEDLTDQHTIIGKRRHGVGDIYERRFKRKDGTTMWTLISASPILDNDGNYAGSFGMLTDITDRKEADAILRESEEKFRSVTQSANEAIITVDSKGVIIEWNRGAEIIFGYSDAEITGKDLQILIPEDYIELHIGGIERLKQGGEPHVIGKTVELHGLHKNGHKFPIELSLAQWESAAGKYFTGIIRDITERKKTEKEVALLAHSIESITECVSITDSEDIIIFVNEAFCDMYKYSKDELIGKHISIVRPENIEQDEVKSILPKTIEGGWKGEVVNRRKDGSLFPVYLSTSVVKDSSKNPVALIGVAIDITEIRNARNQLIIAKEKAEQADKLKSEFLSQMSHEIRTPFNVILGNIDYLKDSLTGITDADTYDCFDGINLASKRIMRTIDLILNLSEIQSGGYQRDITEVDLNSDILPKLINEYQLLLKMKGLVLNYNCEVKNPVLFADVYSITQIFANLIDNAIKYTRDGHIDVSVEKNKSGCYVVTVKDTGIGMNEDFITHLFEPFMQEDKGLTREFEGNGIGLALVKKYCDINNAIIEVESKKNAGSVFRVIFTNK